MNMFNNTTYTRERRKKLYEAGLCAQCGKNPHRLKHLFCEECSEKNRIRQRIRMLNPQLKSKTRQQTHNWKKTIHLQALEKIAKDNHLPFQCQCGCSVPEFLEINHINGNGSKEFKIAGGSSFYRQIIKGERSTNDLNILCKVCNAAYFLERKTGKKWKITYQG